MMTAAAVPEVLRRAAVPLPVPDAASLLGALADAARLSERSHARAVALALDGFGDIVLPDTTPATPDDQALIRGIAPLYLAAQLEEAALVPVVETVSGLAISGGIPLEAGTGAILIHNFWQERNQRFHPSERRAFFTRLFGADDPDALSGARPAMNAAFEDLMIDLAEAFYRLDEQSAAGNSVSPQAQTRVLLASRSLAENLLNKGGGMTAFAATEILATIQNAIHILQQPDVQRVLGGSSLWTAVRAAAARYLRARPDTASYVTRGKSGLIILSWLADSLPRLNDGQPLVTLDHPVVAAAVEWLQASLTIREAGSRAGA
jgi:hypothetical protein